MKIEDLKVIEESIIKGIEHLGADTLLTLNIKYNVQVSEGLKINSKHLNECLKITGDGNVRIDSTFDTFYHDFVSKIAETFNSDQKQKLVDKLSKIDVNSISYYIESTKVINSIY